MQLDILRWIYYMTLDILWWIFHIILDILRWIYYIILDKYYIGGRRSSFELPVSNPWQGEGPRCGESSLLQFVVFSVAIFCLFFCNI